jgi:hypothetical protein
VPRYDPNAAVGEIETDNGYGVAGAHEISTQEQE